MVNSFGADTVLLWIGLISRIFGVLLMLYVLIRQLLVFRTKGPVQHLKVLLLLAGIAIFLSNPVPIIIYILGIVHIVSPDWLTKLGIALNSFEALVLPVCLFMIYLGQ